MQEVLASIQLICFIVGGRNGAWLILVVQHRDTRCVASRNETERERKDARSVSRTDSLSASARAKSVSDSARSPYRSPGCGADGSSCATIAIPSDLAPDVPGRHLELDCMPEQGTAGSARVWGNGAAGHGEKARGHGNLSAVGLISGHRGLLLSHVKKVATLLDHVPRRLPGDDIMVEPTGVVNG